jgi:hypothetical protein
VRRRGWCLAGLFAGLLGGVVPAPAMADVRISVEPARLQIPTVPGQLRILIEGTVAPDAAPAVVVRGRESESVFNRKVRVGPIWLNSGRVHITGTPSLLLVFAPAPLAELLDRADIDAHQLDLQAVRSHMHVEPEAADEAAIRDSYLALRTEDASYRFVEGAPGAVQAGDEPGSYSVVLAWPMKAPPDQYEVSVYECRGGRVTGVATVPLEVVKVGVAAWLAGAATDHAPMYGAVAVAVAISLGFAIDFLVTFLRRRGARRGGSAPAHSTGHLGAH